MARPTLFETDRLRIRPWTLSDADVASAFAIYGDPEVAHFISSTGPEPDIETQRAKLAFILERDKARDDDLGYWAMVEKATGRILGSIILKPLPGWPEIEVGWHLGRFAWGQGYATEAARACIAYGQQTLGLTRIVAVINPLNTRSLAVARRLGMTHEGQIHAYDLDLELFSITTEEAWKEGL